MKEGKGVREPAERGSCGPACPGPRACLILGLALADYDAAAGVRIMRQPHAVHLLHWNSRGGTVPVVTHGGSCGTNTTDEDRSAAATNAATG